MKIRQGFVSNSSSSSFVVYLRENFPADSSILPIDEQKTQLLEAYGFRFGKWVTPMEVELFGKKIREKDTCDECDAETMTYSVLCNEDEVLQFLVQNNIPFEAICHYGHEYVEYNGHNRVALAPNIGEIVFMYGSESVFTDVTMSLLEKDFRLRILTREEYLNEIS